MTTFNLSFDVTPNSKATEIIDAFCEAHGYDPASGVTKLNFVREVIKAFIRDPYAAKALRILEHQAALAVKADADAIAMT